MGAGSIGLLPLVLAGFALAAVAGARRAPLPDTTLRKNVLVWFAAVAICFASVAIPLQLDKSWITIGWALEGLALIALWRRLDHPGLKWFALAHLYITGDKYFVMDAPAFTVCSSTDIGLIDRDVLTVLASNPVLIGTHHAGVELVENPESGLVASQPKLPLKPHSRPDIPRVRLVTR